MEISFDFGLVGNGTASMLSSWLTVAAVTAPHAASHTALMAAAATAPAATSPAIVPTLLALSGGLIAPAAAVAAVAGIAFAGVALSAQGPFRRRSLLFLQRWGRKLRLRCSFACLKIFFHFHVVFGGGGSPLLAVGVADPCCRCWQSCR